MVKGEKQLNDKKRLNFIETTLAGISFITMLGVAYIILGFGSPQLPIPEVSCGNDQGMITPNINAKQSLYIPYAPYKIITSNKKDCYKKSDVLSLNKTVYITDAIALVTLLLTFFGVAIPLIFYLNFEKVKLSIDKKFSYQTRNANEKFLSHKEELSYKIEENINKKVSNFFPAISEIIGNIESFKTEYLTAQTNKQVNNKTAVNNTNEITINLFRLLSEKDEKMTKGLLANIESIFRSNLLDHEENYRVYSFLKYTLRSMYELGVFDTKGKEQALDAFCRKVFKVSLRILLRHEDTV